MPYKISICQASYHSNFQSIKVRNKWLELASEPLRIEHCLGFEERDNQVRLEYGIESNLKTGITSDNLTKFITTESWNQPSAVRNWNNAASISTGDFILIIADDLIPFNNWDNILENFIKNNNIIEGILKFTDDRCHRMKVLKSDTLLPRHPGFVRQTYKDIGYVFDSDFNSLGCDLDLLIRSIKINKLVDAREIKFHHSIGPILDSNNNLLCGCETSKDNTKIKFRTTSQKKMHSVLSKNVKRTLFLKHSHLDRILAHLLCTNKYSNYFAAEIKRQRLNSVVLFIIKVLTRYYLKKLVNPSFRG